MAAAGVRSAVGACSSTGAADALLPCPSHRHCHAPPKTPSIVPAPPPTHPELLCNHPLLRRRHLLAKPCCLCLERQIPACVGAPAWGEMGWGQRKVVQAAGVLKRVIRPPSLQSTAESLQLQLADSLPPISKEVIGKLLAVEPHDTSTASKLLLDSTTRPHKPGLTCRCTECGTGSRYRRAPVEAHQTAVGRRWWDEHRSRLLSATGRVWEQDAAKWRCCQCHGRAVNHRSQFQTPLTITHPFTYPPPPVFHTTSTWPTSALSAAPSPRRRTTRLECWSCSSRMELW